MKRLLVLAGIAFVAMATAVSAQKMTYEQGGEPAFSLVYPLGWEIRTPRAEGRNVISAYPTDGSLLWQGMWIMRHSTGLEESLERLEAMETGLFEEAKLVQEPWTERVGDLALRCYKGTGIYKEDQKVESFMALFELPDGQIGAIGYIGAPEAIETHAEDLHAMLLSLEVVP